MHSAPDLPGPPEQFLWLPVSIGLLFPFAVCLGSAQELGTLWFLPDQPLRVTAVPLGRDDMLDVETDAYIHCVSAFVKLAQSEYRLLMEIIPEHHQKKTFDSLIQVSPLLARCSEH